MAIKNKTILHADDVPRWRDYVSALLSDAYVVESVEDFDAALARLDRGGIDLLVLDHLMPGTEPTDDSAAVCADLRKSHPDLPIVVFTGALADSPTTREEFEKAVGVPVALKENAGTPEDTLRALVDKLLEE